MGELFDQNMLEKAEWNREFSPESFVLLLGNEDMLKRNAHTEPRVLTGGNVVDWSALLMPGGLRPFVISVISALYHEGNKTGVDRLLQCMFGSFYKSDVDSVETTPGAKGVHFGAFVQFQVIGHAANVAISMRNWVKFMSRDPFGGELATILGIMSLLKKVNGIPAKALGTTAYAVDLGTGMVSDALLAKALGMFVRAAVNASHDLDPTKSAKVVRVCFELSEVSGTMSKLHFNTSGELGTKAKSGCMIDGRQFIIYETKAPQQRAHLYLFANGLDTSDLTKETVAKWLCIKAGMSAEHITVGDWRMTKTMGIEGGVVLLMADTDLAKILRLGSPVAGTTNSKNAEFVIDADDVNVLMLGPETDKVFVGGSVAVLKDCLNKGGQEYEETRKAGPGAGGGVAAAELTNIRQQMQAGLEQQAAAVEALSEKTDANFSSVIEKANADSQAHQAKVDALQRNLVAAHKALTMQSAENAL